MNYLFMPIRSTLWLRAMHEAGNFLVPKIALPVILLSEKGYLSTARFFAFLAWGGAIRMFKFFYYMSLITGGR